VEQFALNEDQKAVVQAVRRVVKESVEPRAGEIDATGEYPWDIKKLFSELGFLGAHVPVEYGGTGQGLLTLCLIIEEVAKSCASSSLIIADQELSLTPIMIGGSEEQKKRYLPKLATGEWLGAFCLTEPGAGSDAGAVSTKAVRDGDAWVLNGTKCFITNGGVAHVYVVFAKTDPEEGIKGISAFAVEADAPGVKVGKHEDKMGIRGSSTTDVIFEDCRIPADNLLGSEGGGFGIAMATLDRTRPGVGAQGLGIAQGALDFAVEYMKERKQFGQPMRYLLYKAAARIDEEGKDGRVRLSAEAGKLSAMAKLKASDVAMRVTTEAVQLLGGYGYMKDYPLERMMRDAKITQIYEGTNQIQRTVIGTRILS
jgi:alkylation response protein AidB-like acyl-CoA dehydrogenase